MDPAIEPSPPNGRHPRRLRHRLRRFVRNAHLTLSTFCLLAVLILGVTGLLINHPEWSFNSGGSMQEVSGQLPGHWDQDSDLPWNRLEEFLKETHHLHGNITDLHADADNASLAFKAPGYAAVCKFSVRTGRYTMTIANRGPVNLLNDLHRGRDAGPAWAWFMDGLAVAIVFAALLGLLGALQIRKSRRLVVWTLIAGVVVTVLLIRLSI